jgi:hypothetical protein
LRVGHDRYDSRRRDRARPARKAGKDKSGPAGLAVSDEGSPGDKPGNGKKKSSK